ncbi:MAG: GNAT family N-acetyltransferase [Candidatus Hermodarchaeota archaeon]
MDFRKGYSANVDNHFSIHIATESEEELQAIVNLNMKVHQEEVLKTYIPRIFLEHPRKSEILWLYIKDDKENKLMSSICLAPMEWQINESILPVCEMEFVGTLEKYREKGFIKVLNELYERIMEQKGYILSVIRGIPFFYRSLGYEYVSSLDERIIIPASKIPSEKFKKINIRLANLEDLPFIEDKYTKFHKNYFIFNYFDIECFKFKYLNDEYNTELRSTYILQESGKSENYFSFGMSYDNLNFEISCPDLTNNEMITLLQFIKAIGNYASDDNIILSVNEHTSLYNFIRTLGGKPISTYGWQVKIPNLKNFISLIKNILENRINNSEFKGLTKTVRISNYSETILIDFSNGKIRNIEKVEEHPDPKITDLMIPEAILFKLILGDRTIDEINHIVKDAIVNISSKSLIETLFPKEVSLLGSNL